MKFVKSTIEVAKIGTAAAVLSATALPAIAADITLRGASLFDENHAYTKTLREFERIIGEEYDLSLIHISEPTRQAEISYAVFCLKNSTSRQTKFSHCKNAIHHAVVPDSNCGIGFSQSHLHSTN